MEGFQVGFSQYHSRIHLKTVLWLALNIFPLKQSVAHTGPKRPKRRILDLRPFPSEVHIERLRPGHLLQRREQSFLTARIPEYIQVQQPNPQ